MAKIIRVTETRVWEKELIEREVHSTVWIDKTYSDLDSENYSVEVNWPIQTAEHGLKVDQYDYENRHCSLDEMGYGDSNVTVEWEVVES